MHADQTGCVKSRQIAGDMRKLIHIMRDANSSHEPVIAISLEAEKAFGRIQWPYLFKTLNKHGFGPTFINDISLIYSRPRARIVTDSIVSETWDTPRL